MNWNIGGAIVAVIVIFVVAGALVELIQIGVRNGMADTLSELQNISKTLDRIEKAIERSR